MISLPTWPFRFYKDTSIPMEMKSIHLADGVFLFLFPSNFPTIIKELEWSLHNTPNI